MLSSIPSPSSNTMPVIGLHYYGVMIALGVLAAVMLARARWRAAGHDPDEIADIAVWAVPAGLIGTRVYHVITDFDKYRDNLGQIFAIWNGGLGIPGGILFGVIAGVWAARHYGIDVNRVADACIPGLPLAQAIGRLGNYFNQELFGRPTDVPWAIEIDPIHRPAQYVQFETFHPTFAYEALWNLGLCAALILVGRRKVLRPGKLLPLYLIGYGVGRFWVELLRSDHATEILGLRVNTWTSGAMVLIGFGWLLFGGALRPEAERGWDPEPEVAPEAEGVAGAAEGEGAAGAAGEVGVEGEAGVGSGPAEGANDGVAEDGPQGQGPVSEVEVPEADKPE